MRRTIITPNRFITYIQSWLVKTSLFFLFTAFIFFLSQDNLNTIGVKPNSLITRVLNSKNRFITTSGETVLAIYAGSMVSDKNNLILGQDRRTNVIASALSLVQTDNVYSYKGLFTGYFQMPYFIEDKTKRLTRYALAATDPSVGKSITRLVFNKNNLKLRIDYTTSQKKKIKACAELLLT